MSDNAKPDERAVIEKTIGDLQKVDDDLKNAPPAPATPAPQQPVAQPEKKPIPFDPADDPLFGKGGRFYLDENGMRQRVKE